MIEQPIDFVCRTALEVYTLRRKKEYLLVCGIERIPNFGFVIYG